MTPGLHMFAGAVVVCAVVVGFVQLFAEDYVALLPTVVILILAFALYDNTWPRGEP